MQWKNKLVSQIINVLGSAPQHSEIFDRIISDSSVSIHLAIFNEPFLTLILEGVKKIETRFSINKISPYLKVKKGDIVILKKSGGMVTGFFIAGSVKYVENLTTDVLEEIENEYGNLICSGYDKYFWEYRKNANYATLIEIKKVRRIEPITSEKRDRTSWVVLRKGLEETFFV
ncbi:MAG: hypothetical protein HND52_15075 [Ignavibacteriae bacterium]|nr:hypothetical protein [Ignavibacteriota bacterium]NOG99277.1 hypothetical protein [Ignavibacteriota bacterium]